MRIQQSGSSSVEGSASRDRDRTGKKKSKAPAILKKDKVVKEVRVDPSLRTTPVRKEGISRNTAVELTTNYESEWSQPSHT